MCTLLLSEQMKPLIGSSYMIKFKFIGKLCKLSHQQFCGYLVSEVTERRSAPTNKRLLPKAVKRTL